MNRKLPVNIASLLMIYALLSVSLIYTHNFTLYNSFGLLLCVLGLYFAGSAILLPTGIPELMQPLSYTGISVFIGGLFLSLSIFITTNPLLLIALLLVVMLTVILLFRNRIQVEFLPDVTGIVTFGVALLVIALISSGELSRIFSAEQIGTNIYSTDSYFFTSIVSSYRKGTLFSAAYEINSPLNYQALGFFIPAFFSDILHVTSHQALWGLTMPFYKLIAIVMWYELFYYFVSSKVSRSNYLFLVLALFFPILLAPLHPLYVAKGEIRNFIFNGIGYLVPAGTIAYPVSIIVFLSLLYLFSILDWAQKGNLQAKLLFAVILGILAIGKMPLYICFMMFLAVVIFIRVALYKEKITNYLWFGLLSLFITYVTFKICMGQSPSGVTYFKYGYLTHLFGIWMKRSSVGFINNLIILGLIPVVYLIWIGIRLVGMAYMARSKNRLFIEFFFGGVFSLLLSTLLASFLHIEIRDDQNRVVIDNTFNVDQFLRSEFFILNILSSIGLLYLLFSAELSLGKRRVLLVGCVVWCGLAATTLLVSGKWSMLSPRDEWYYENYSVLKSGKLNDGLIAVNPALQYYGIMLASSDLGTYWSAMDQSSGNYNSTKKNKYRWELFSQLLSGKREQELQTMKQDGVKYIVSTPIDSAQFGALHRAYPQLIAKVPDAEWIYRLN